MSNVPFIGLLNNAALLLALGVFYGTLSRHTDSWSWKITRGFFLGVIAVGVMLNPWQLAPGMIFDTRTIVLSVGGMFLGAVPTAIAVGMAALYRAYVGGVGTFTGITWVVTSGFLGVAWVHLRRRPAYRFSWREFYLGGLALHGILLLLMFTMPRGLALPILGKITLPILTIYPVATVLLARLLAGQELQRINQAALDLSERKYRELVENSRVILLQVDLSGTILFINDYGEAFFGYAPGDLLGRNVLGSIVPKMDSVGGDLERRIRAILATPEDFSDNENENICRDGRRVRIQWKNTPLRDDAGRIVGTQCIGYDVTELRLAEEILRGREDQLRRLVDLSPVPLAILARDKRVVFVNCKFTELFGYSLADLPTVADWWTRACPDETYREEVRERWHAAVTRAIEEGIPFEPQEMRVARVDGAVLDVAVLFSAIGGQDVVVFQDMTREREVDRLKSEFIATAAHELRTPLTAIRGFTEVLLEGGDFDEARRKEFLTIVHGKTEVLEKIIDDLFTLGRVESGRVIRLEKTPCDILALVSSLLHTYRCEYPDRTFLFEWPEGSSPILEADATKIGQVLDNLLSNAIKFSPSGSPIRVLGSVVGGEEWITVQNEGIGMTPAQQARVFDKFYRVDSSDTAVPGLGLGMAIAREIIEAHGGRIRIASAPGEGATFTFALPLKKDLAAVGQPV